jgi:hypothetical protein
MHGSWHVSRAEDKYNTLVSVSNPLESLNCTLSSHIATRKTLNITMQHAKGTRSLVVFIQERIASFESGINTLPINVLINFSDEGKLKQYVRHPGQSITAVQHIVVRGQASE